MNTLRTADFDLKLSELRNILKEKNAYGLTLSMQNHFAWLTGGRAFIGTASVAACGTIVVTNNKAYLIAENIEAVRLYKEQTDENEAITVVEYPWHLPQKRAEIMRELFGDKKMLTEADVATELFSLRTVMTDYEKECYRDICKTTAKEMEAVCKSLKDGMTEYEVAGMLCQRFWANNLEPITLLLGFDERALNYRHPVINGAKLKNYALLAVCTRRNGLIANATRLVALHRDETMLERQRVCGYVDATFVLNTVPGADTADIFKKAMAAYAEKGYSGEWKLHHQGGVTGYVPREVKAMEDVHHIVRAGEVYSWNPSVQGAKSENTILITENGYENLTHTGTYSYLEYELNGKRYLTEDVLIIDELK